MCKKQNTFISGQFLLDYGPWLVFTISTYNGKSFALNSPYTSKWIMIKLIDGRPFCLVLQETKHFYLWSVFTRLCPPDCFLLYTHIMEILCQTSCPWLLDFNLLCDKSSVVGALVSSLVLSTLLNTNCILMLPKHLNFSALLGSH